MSGVLFRRANQSNAEYAKSTSLTSVFICRHWRDNGRKLAHGHIADTGFESVWLLYRNREPLPQGASISVKIAAGKAGFQARGRVIYSDPNSGSGVEFQGVEPRYQAILEEWLLEAQGMDHIDKGTD